MKSKAFLRLYGAVFLVLCSSFCVFPLQAQQVCQNSLPGDIQYRSVVNTLFPEGGDINPSYVTDTASPNLMGLSPTTTVAVTFLGSVTGYSRNRLGYFLFNASNEIVDAGAVIFNDASTTAAGTTVVVGPFPANSNLGFYLDVNGSSPPAHVFYSLQNLNSDHIRHFAAAFVPGTENVAFGVEDLLNGGDTDYNDMVFATTVCGTVNYCNISDNYCDTSCNNDPDCECTPGQSQERSCGSDEGECVAGSQSRTCGEDHRWQAWGECNGAVVPSPEICDGLDNDCDDSIDEELTDVGASCATGEEVLGACASTGSIVCEGGHLVCNALAGSPSAEVCDETDNDCDGQVDEGNVCVIEECQENSEGQSCSVGTGACQVTGSITCTEEGAVCNASAGTPSTEICDEIDNDCDGSIDEEGVCQSNQCDESQIGQSCVVGRGTCQGSGFLTCVEGALVCNAQESAPSAETCDSLDNNCNGEIDEGLDCGSSGDENADPSLTPGAGGTGAIGDLEGQGGCALTLEGSSKPMVYGLYAFALGMIAFLRKRAH